MDTLEITMQAVGWVGMVLILVGYHQRTRLWKQVIMSSGAALLGIMSAYPQVHPVFLPLQAAIASVGFLNIRPGREHLKMLTIVAGAAVGCYGALRITQGIETWFAFVGLIGIALGYGAKPKNQPLWLGIGAVGMVLYSLFGVLDGVWQAWPFLVLNIPFAYWGLRDAYKARQHNTAVQT